MTALTRCLTFSFAHTFTDLLLCVAVVAVPVGLVWAWRRLK